VAQADDGRPSYGLTDVVAGLEALIGQPHISEDYVRFRIDLLKAQSTVCETLDKARRPISRGDDGDGHQPPTPALTPEMVEFDGELLESLCDALREAATKPGRAGGDLARLAEAAQEKPDVLEELSRRAAFGPDRDQLESLSRQLEIGADALLFAGRTLAAPFVTAAARRVRPAGGRSPEAPRDSGSCRVCGSPPGLATLEHEEGKRFLFCSLCGDRYGFRRLACPHCGTRESEALSYLRLNAADPRWIETCNKLPDRYPLIPIVEETATLSLDLLAEREGCARGLPYAACF
jgi:formate dehydrogenase maturation protein FdhE